MGDGLNRRSVLRLNPEYEAGPFELGYVCSGQLDPKLEPNPMRFRQKDINTVLELMQKNEMGKVRELSIPKYIQ